VARLDAPAAAKLLRELGRRIALTETNPFRARAYVRAADSLETLTEPLDRTIAENRLTEVPGIGDALAAVIAELHRTGTYPLLEKLRPDIPEGVLNVLSVPGLRPDKILLLYKEGGITGLAELEKAASEDRLRGIKGIGAALQRKILQGLAIHKTTQGARHVHRAAEQLAAAEAELRQSQPGLVRVVAAGGVRRGGEIVADLAVVAEVERLEGERPGVVKSGALAVHMTDAQHFGSSLLQATGSERHLQQLRDLAASAGLSLSPDGLRRGREMEIVASRAEEDVYKALGLPYIEPELREGRDEIALAKAGRLSRLVRSADVNGILHAHTDASDGVNTLKEMAEAARSRGYQYIGITDHSRSAHYAGGLTIREVEEQHAEIDRLNARFGGSFRIFKGIESDILPDGSLDYPDDILRRFDLIIASVHGQFRMDPVAQTERLVRAAANPFVSIIGHMTGRQLLRRPGYDLDIERVLHACAEHGVAVEINGNPWRLDLDWRWHQRGCELGCLFSINPDAHSVPEIDSSTHWGVEVARKGGLGRDCVVNTLDLSAFTRWLDTRRSRAVA
jgi:DNA polymerase (family 10)